MVELVNTNNLGLFDREIVQVQVLFPLVDLFYINPASFIPLNSRFIPSRPPAPLSLLLERGAGYASVPSGCTLWGSGGIRQGFRGDPAGVCCGLMGP